MIGFDSGVDSDIPVATAATDNLAAAALAADKMAELIGGEGEVAVIAHDQTSRTGIDRGEGFTDQIDEQVPEHHDRRHPVRRWRPAQVHRHGQGHHPGPPEPEGLLRRQRRLDHRRAERASRNWAWKARSSSSATTPASSRWTPSAAASQAGAITQDPVGIGYKCVEAAVKAIKGETLPKIIDTGFMWYDKTNIDSAEMQPLLYD